MELMGEKQTFTLNDINRVSHMALLDDNEDDTGQGSEQVTRTLCFC